MDELISRKAAIKMICEGGYMAAALAKVEALPTIDAEPVRHGKWVYHEDDLMSWNSCSLCGCEAFDLHGANYCPNCGAKMDLEDDQHDPHTMRTL